MLGEKPDIAHEYMTHLKETVKKITKKIEDYIVITKIYLFETETNV